MITTEPQKPFSSDNLPLEGEVYWFLNIDGNRITKHGLRNVTYGNDKRFDSLNIEIGNCYRTVEEGSKAWQRLLIALKGNSKPETLGALTPLGEAIELVKKTGYKVIKEM